MTIPVEPIIDEVTWLAAQEQLDRNYEQAKRNNGVNFYLLRGLIRCQVCGGKYSGQFKNGRRRYRCTNYDYAISGDGSRCRSRSFAALPVEEAVWSAVTGLLKSPQRIRQEMEARVAEVSGGQATGKTIKYLEKSILSLKSQQDRLTDGYVAGAIELDSFKQRMDDLTAQKNVLERQVDSIRRSEEATEALKESAVRLEEFATTVSQGIQSLGDQDRQRLLQLIVEDVRVNEETVTISTVIEPPAQPSEPGSLRSHHPELDSESLGSGSACSAGARRAQLRS